MDDFSFSFFSFATNIRGMDNPISESYFEIDKMNHKLHLDIVDAEGEKKKLYICIALNYCSELHHIKNMQRFTFMLCTIHSRKHRTEKGTVLLM